MAPAILGDVLTFKTEEIVCYVPIHAITMVYQDPDGKWYVDISGEPSFLISQETAIYLLGEGTIYNGPRPGA